ncbi:MULTISPECIES: PP2C family protein-serine/threonine phosphatase [unclassified Sedimentibacter]|uniref:PP2C family protein-serine/threonine phosphatase n=1 Tax=unclassified Sedimentibacter TaxID=2649220 RepID=UPI0027E0D191|nr:PP2C family protein-serine/threonine phosphatase [Sedimentibacter sp. MB35-C1]WMJ76755.1 PP2C family protein-serine/threonine phosphatase [Sedimentibacter sp. MB35-C1]
MIGQTNDKRYITGIIGEFLKNEIKHIKENWIVFMMCFFIARQNIIDEIFPFAVVVLSSYCYAQGSSVSMLLTAIFAVLFAQSSFVYVIILIAVYAYFLNFKDERHSILIAAGYSSIVLLVSKTTILLADGFSVNGLMLNTFETIFVFSAIIITNEIIKVIKNIKYGFKKENVHRIKNKKAKKIKKSEEKSYDKVIKFANKESERNVDAKEEAASTASAENNTEYQREAGTIKNIAEFRKPRNVSIFTDKAKTKIKEQLLWQNINVKFFEVVSSNKNTISLSVTVKTEKSCEEAESAIELIVRNVCGVKLKCTERVVASKDYYVLKFKNIKRIKIRTYSASAVKEGSEVSGDNFAYAGRADRYYTVLCDGIGSGEEAYNESNGAVDLLSKFLYTDFSEAQILRTLNSILMIKLGEERFVTFDFNIIDYSSREIRIYKAGAAPSYLISGKTVDKISGKSLPLGILDNFEYSSFKKKVEIGDLIIMVSDGIIDSIGMDTKKSLDKYIEYLVNKDPQTIANSILSYALRGQDKIIDDMTVLVTKIG